MADALVVALDPGTAQTGVALFRGGRLAQVEVLVAAKGTLPDRQRRMARGVVALVESWLSRPELAQAVYVVEDQYIPRHGAQGDPADVLAVAKVAGAVQALLPWSGTRLVLPQPAAWKGSVGKSQGVRWFVSMLDETEAGLVEEVGYNHNAMDAVGLGLWRLGRLDRNVDTARVKALFDAGIGKTSTTTKGRQV